MNIYQTMFTLFEKYDTICLMVLEPYGFLLLKRVYIIILDWEN